jgi:hypothetical protein
MSATPDLGFGKFVPGFDFLQNLAQGTTQGLPQLPGWSSWIAPTLSVDELDKRISELKAVHFWLDQNGKALAATIQALEVQKMTLATLQGMNFNMGEVANALKMKIAEPAPAAARKTTEAAPEAAAKAATKSTPKAAPEGDGNGAASTATAAVDPLQWWGSLTQQFQAIAANAMQDVAQKAGMEAGRAVAKADPAGKTAARKAAPRKAARKAASGR